MYLPQRYPWLLSFVVAFEMLLLTIVSGNDVIEPVSLGIWLAFVVVICLVGLGLCWLVFLLLPWRKQPEARRAFHFVVRLSLLLVVIAVSYDIWLTSDSNYVSEAKAYVKLAEPRIEKYYQINHRYPESLASLDLGIPAPRGLDYRVVGAVIGDDEWAVESDHNGERYVIFFGDLWYHGNGEWAVGHL